MARLAHNDYLQQASDSGIPGFLAYAIFIGGALVYSAPFRFRRGDLNASPAKSEEKAQQPGIQFGWVEFALWLGVLGWALQQVAEFGLYIPALAWPAFTFMGWLLRHVTESNTTAA
jgi:hypothetical protein